MSEAIHNSGAFICSLHLSANVLPDSPVYSSSQSTLPHLYLNISPLFCQTVSLSLGLTRRSLIVPASLKVHLCSKFAVDVFTAFNYTLDISHHCVSFLWCWWQYCSWCCWNLCWICWF